MSNKYASINDKNVVKGFWIAPGSRKYDGSINRITGSFINWEMED